MARTRRKVPPWVHRCEIREAQPHYRPAVNASKEASAHKGLRVLRRKIATDNWDHSNKERRLEEEYQDKLKREADALQEEYDEQV